MFVWCWRRLVIWYFCRACVDSENAVETELERVHAPKKSIQREETWFQGACNQVSRVPGSRQSRHQGSCPHRSAEESGCFNLLLNEFSCDPSWHLFTSSWQISKSPNVCERWVGLYWKMISSLMWICRSIGWYQLFLWGSTISCGWRIFCLPQTKRWTSKGLILVSPFLCGRANEYPAVCIFKDERHPVQFTSLNPWIMFMLATGPNSIQNWGAPTKILDLLEATGNLSNPPAERHVCRLRSELCVFSAWGKKERMALLDVRNWLHEFPVCSSKYWEEWHERKDHW